MKTHSQTDMTARRFYLPFVGLFLLGACGGVSTDYDPGLPLVALPWADGMVAQRDVVLPVWGWTSPGSEVTVSMDREVQKTKAGLDGAWRVELAPRPAGGSHALSVSSAEEGAEISDILFGDVWVASGQSNMEWKVRTSDNAAVEIASADDGSIRHFYVPHEWSDKAEVALTGGPWAPADPQHVADFTAVGYFFARELRKHVDVPIGLMHTSWGGSRIEPWMSPKALGLSPEDAAALAQAQARQEDEAREEMRQLIGDFPESDPGLVDGVAHWAARDLDMSDWNTISVPAVWEQVGYAGLDGVVWFRTSVVLSEAEAASEALLALGTIDDNDITWVNGVEVGRTNAWNVARKYAVPACALHEGLNAIAVRVDDTGGNGGLYGSPDGLYLETQAQKHALSGDWSLRVGMVSLATGAAKNQVPMVLYNKMIHPLLDFPVKGFLWYQGESNASGQDAVDYAGQFKSMIMDWRSGWGVGDAPFLFVQLANFRAAKDEPSESDWAVLRESQSAALGLPNVGQAVITDIGEATDIHPTNKQDVGLRLSLAARHFAYGQEVVYAGPTYRGHRQDGSSIVIDYDHVGGGLEARRGPLAGFAVAGSDGLFHWADARIEGETVVVSSPSGIPAVAVRYAWADNPDRANLYNTQGLPAAPFRTDVP
ncbi:MAG: sialate O-acetylesterase [Rhodothermales bacterium]|jgi:sialate O-acetylesterase